MFLKQAINLGGHEITIETGRVAKQADGAVLISQGETVVLVTAVSARKAKEGEDAIEPALEGLASCQPTAGRMALRKGPSGVALIDDSYNANPGSVHAALAHLAGLSGQRIVVFGNMAELGPAAPELHQEIGKYARGRCDLLFAIGDLASEAATAFGAAGRRVADIDAARAALDPLLASDVTVLLRTA